MQKNANPFVIGLAAGLATALLSAGVVSGMSFGIALYFLSPLPLMAAALGWGINAGVIAALVAGAGIAVTIAPLSALVVAATTLLPGLTGAWFFGLARPASELGGPSHGLAWYPLPDTLLRMGIAVSAGFIAIGVAVGYGPELVREIVDTMVAQVAENNPEIKTDDASVTTIAGLLEVLLPVIQTGLWFAVLAGNLYLAARLTQAWGIFGRPPEFWPLALRMPKPALIVFAVALALSFISGGIGHIGAALAGPVAFGFAMAGIAMLHNASRGRPARAMLLFFAYAGLLLFLPVFIGFLLAGLFDTTRTAPVSGAGSNPPKS